MFELFQARVDRTPKDTIYREGKGSIYRFRGAGPNTGSHVPVLLVPSMLNRWYIFDLRKGASVAAAVSAGAPWDTFLFDWGVPEDEDRFLTWDDIVAKLARVVRRVLRETGSSKVAIVGYSMGATLSSIYTALHPSSVAALVNLAGPIDFAHAGRLGTMVDERWFDPEAVTSAGNLPGAMMQTGVMALAPTDNISRWVGVADQFHDVSARDAFAALDSWGRDTVPFPAAAYVTYIRELYQQNLLFKGEHRVQGKRVDLKDITCPVMSIVPDSDVICPPAAATALNDKVSSAVKEVLSVPGGHVGGVIGTRAAKEFYPHLRSWLEQHGAITPLPESRL